MDSVIEETGFKIMNMKEFRRLKFSTLDPKPKAVFINQRKILKPYEDTLTQYHDWLRRFSNRPPHVQRANALRASSYDANYRRKLMRYPASMALMRELGEISRKRLVLMVETKDRPDSEIIVSIIKRMGWG